MGNNYDIILIGLVAVFLILRLRSVLGKRTGNERPPARDPFTPPAPPTATPRVGDRGDAPANQGNDNVVPLPTANAPAPRPRSRPAARAASAPPSCRPPRPASRPFAPPIPASSPSASPPARAPPSPPSSRPSPRATRRSLRPLLDGPTFSSFEAAIRGRVERKEKAETTLIGFEASDVAAAELQGSNASVTVRFVSEQINVLRNADGQIIDGNPNEVQKVIDLWTFRRDTKSSDPNWLLVKTESEG